MRLPPLIVIIFIAKKPHTMAPTCAVINYWQILRHRHQLGRTDIIRKHSGLGSSFCNLAAPSLLS